MRIRRPVIYTAASAAAIATAGLLASPAMASTTQFPFQGQGFNLYNNYGNAHGTVTGNQFGQFGQWGQQGRGSVTVSGTVSSNRFGFYGNRHGVTEEVFLSSNSWSAGQADRLGRSRPERPVQRHPVQHQQRHDYAVRRQPVGRQRPGLHEPVRHGPHPAAQPA